MHPSQLAIRLNRGIERRMTSLTELAENLRSPNPCKSASWSREKRSVNDLPVGFRRTIPLVGSSAMLSLVGAKDQEGYKSKEIWRAQDLLKKGWRE